MRNLPEMGAVDRCPCMGLVSPTEVHTDRRDGQEVMLHWRHGCGFEGSTRLTWGAYRRFAALRRAMLVSMQREIDIELAVNGFAADLTAVETLDDVTEVWVEQARWLPQSIPREVDRA